MSTPVVFLPTSIRIANGSLGVSVDTIGKCYAVVRAESYEYPSLARKQIHDMVKSIHAEDIKLHLLRLFNASSPGTELISDDFEEHLISAFTAMLQLRERAKGLQGNMRFFFPKPGQKWDASRMEDHTDLRGKRKDGPVALTIFPGLIYTSENGMSERAVVKAHALRDAKTT